MSVHINRRFPVYEFVVRIDQPVELCRAAMQRRMHPVPLAKDASGTIAGNEFQLRPTIGLFAPFTRVDGYMIPQEASKTDVVVTVRLDLWLWASLPLSFLFATAMVFTQDSPEGGRFGVALLALAGLVAVFAAGHLAQASRARTAIESWLGPSESN